MRDRRLIQPLCLALFASVSFRAHAQSDKSGAVMLFDDAQRLMEAGKYAEACPKFAESNRLDPQLGALLHLADCYEKAGKYASAWAMFRDAADLADRRADARSLSAKDRAAALEAKLSRLTIVVPQASVVPGMDVRRDGVSLGPLLWGTPVPVDPGAHRVEVSAPGRLSWQTSVRVDPNGSTATVNVPVLAVAPGGAPGSSAGGPSGVAGSTELDTAKPGATQRVLGWVALGGGIVGLGVGTLFTIQRSSKLNDRDEICPSGVDCTLGEQNEIDALTDEARSAGTVGAIGFVAGGVLVAGGAALILTAPKGTPGTGVAPILGPGIAGVTLSRTW